jgi:hypothetical protein
MWYIRQWSTTHAAFGYLGYTPSSGDSCDSGEERDGCSFFGTARLILLRWVGTFSDLEV